MRPIRTPEDHQVLLDEIAALIGAAPGTPEADRLEVLAVLASEYERRNVVEAEAADPVELLSLTMRGKGLGQADLSEVLGSRARASEILSRRRSLSAEMVERLSRAWSIPKRLLSGPARAEARPRRLGKAASIAALVVSVGAAGAAAPFLWYGRDLPDVAPLVAEAQAGAPVASLPPHLVQAFIAGEDQRFLGHDGYDPAAIARAAGQDLVGAGDHPAGGATLTQQLVKVSLLRREPRSIRRKVREILLARRIEQRLSKDQILGLYLAHVYFGGGAWGIDAAAHRYFGRSPAELSLAQSAYLASLVDAPNDLRFDKPGNAARALAARDRTLARMTRAGFLTPATAKAAELERLW
jgi:penicillin-binding protein 1A